MLRHCEKNHPDLEKVQEKSSNISLKKSSEFSQDLTDQQNSCISAFGRIRKKNPKYDEIEQINCAFKMQNGRKKQSCHEIASSVNSSLISGVNDSCTFVSEEDSNLSIETSKLQEKNENLSKSNEINKGKQVSVSVYSNSKDSLDTQLLCSNYKRFNQCSVLNVNEELIKLISLDSSNQLLEDYDNENETDSKNNNRVMDESNGIFISSDPNCEKVAQHSVIFIVSSNDENGESHILSEIDKVTDKTSKETEEPFKKKLKVEINSESQESFENDPEFTIDNKDLYSDNEYYTKRKRKWSRTCKGCGEVFSRLKSFNIHKYECKGDTKVNINWKLKSVMLPCPTCGVDVHKGKGKYRNHIKRCAVDLPGKKTFCLHPSCVLRFYHVHWMLQHVKKVHTDINVDVRNLVFKTMEDFQKWKEEEEASTMTYFYKSTGFASKNIKEGEAKSFYYNCQHNGDSKPHTKSKQRLTDKRWQKGSSKFGFCPARMNLKKLSNGEIRLYYIASHSHEVGKLSNTAHQPLPEDVERYIVQELKQDTTMTDIQDSLARGVLLYAWEGESEDKRSIIRRHVVSLAQIKKRKDKLNLGVEGLPHLDTADCEKLSRLIKSLESQEFSPVITYKPQGAPLVIGALELDELPFSAELFALGLQTKQQFDMMCQQLSNINVICVDTVYSKRSLEFYLFTIMLPDGKGNGRGNAVAHFVTNQRDEITLRYLFSSLKERFPRLKLDAIVTDDTLSGQKCFNALCSVFGEARRLLCHNFIKKRWRWKIKLFAKGNITLKNEIMVYLEEILGEMNVEFLNQLCFSFVEKFNEICPQICEYFTQCYLKRIETWGKCHRISLGSNIDYIPYSHFLHDKLRICYKNYHRRSRICDLTELLLDLQTSSEQHVKVEGIETVGEDDEVDMSADAEDSLKYQPIVESFLDIQQPSNPADEVVLDSLLSSLESVKVFLGHHRQQSVGCTAQQTQLMHHLSSHIKTWMHQWQASVENTDQNIPHQHTALISNIPHNGTHSQNIAQHTTLLANIPQNISQQHTTFIANIPQNTFTTTQNLTQQHTTLIANVPHNTEPLPVDAEINAQIISVGDTSMHFVSAIDEGSAGYADSCDSKTQFPLSERHCNIQSPYIVTASMANSVKESEIAVRNLITNITY